MCFSLDLEVVFGGFEELELWDWRCEAQATYRLCIRYVVFLGPGPGLLTGEGGSE